MPSPDQPGGPLLVVDDDDLFVAFASTLLESAGFRTLTASSGEEALSLARAHTPPVVLLDIQLPGLNGWEVCRALRHEMGQSVAIAFVSGSKTDTIDVSAGLLLGADDFLVKPCDPSELLARVGALRRRVARANGSNGTSRSLTTRELEVLRLLSDGLNQKEIARILSISPKTVGIHIEHILGKLEVHSRAQAVAAAYRENLLSFTG